MERMFDPLRVLTPLLLLLLAALAPAQSKASAVPQFDAKRAQMQLEQSQRHLEYGLDLRKQGMTLQAAEEIVLAAQLGAGRNPAAAQVLSIMRQYDAAFWKRYGSRPSKGKVESYNKKAASMAAVDRKERLELANWAFDRELIEQAEAEYKDLLGDSDEPLIFDAKGQIVIRAGVIPKKASEKLRAEAISINGRLYVRDEMLAKLPKLEQIHEVSSPALRVRTTTSLEHAQDAHAMCSQLLPELAAEMGAVPTRRLSLFLFASKPDYEATLDALGMGEHKLVAGVAMPSPPVAMVCMEGLPEEVARGVILHEATHLFAFSVSRSVLPPWYSEGFADTFGGTGTFSWDGSKLVVKGMFERSRIEALQVEGGTMALRDFLEADQFEQWRRGHDVGLAFYAQSWAFLRYLRSGAGDEIAARFAEWEARCRGQLLGFELGSKRSANTRAANDLFVQMFEADLPKLERGFEEWLKHL